MKLKISFFLLLFSILLFSQIKFKEGYFIKDDGSKINCLIKDMGWNSNPQYVFYKGNQDADTKKIDIQNLKEFYVDGNKYVKFSFKIDNSPILLNQLTIDKNPVWVEKTSFLKLLVEGKTQLYKFSENGNKKFFVKKINSENVEQLIYKKYLDYQNSESVVKNNNEYKKQLDSINPNIETSNTNYDEKSLTKWFIKNSGIFNDEKSKKEKGKFNINPKIGYLYSSGKFDSSSSIYSNVNFDSSNNLSFSLEFEYILGVNKSKWSFFVEPTYINFKNEKRTSVKYSDVLPELYRIYLVNNSSIIIPVGVKHYMFLNETNKIFLSGSFVFGIPIESKITIKEEGKVDTYDSYSTSEGFQLGLGYVYKNKFSIEGKYIHVSSPINSGTKILNSNSGIYIGYHF